MSTTYFFALLFATDDYRTGQQIYRGWALFGIVIFGAILSTFVLTLQLRRNTVRFLDLHVPHQLYDG